jgi:predicted nucleic acid-binding Zn ribbon protein
MGGRPFQEIPCTTCAKPIGLTVDLCTDECGKAIHENCYVEHVRRGPKEVSLPNTL